MTIRCIRRLDIAVAVMMVATAIFLVWWFWR